MSEGTHRDGRGRHRSRPRPAPSPRPEAKRRHGSGIVVAGFVLSLVALVPPAWLAIEFAIDHDGWFSNESDGAFFSGAFWSAFFVIFLVIPVELLLAGSGFVLSLLGIKRVSQTNSRMRHFGVAGTVISAVAILAMAAITVFAIANIA